MFLFRFGASCNRLGGLLEPDWGPLGAFLGLSEGPPGSSSGPSWQYSSPWALLARSWALRWFWEGPQWALGRAREDSTTASRGRPKEAQTKQHKIFYLVSFGVSFHIKTIRKQHQTKQHKIFYCVSLWGLLELSWVPLGAVLGASWGCPGALGGSHWEL